MGVHVVWLCNTICVMCSVISFVITLLVHVVVPNVLEASHVILIYIYVGVLSVSRLSCWCHCHCPWSLASAPTRARHYIGVVGRIWKKTEAAVPQPILVSYYKRTVKDKQYPQTHVSYHCNITHSQTLQKISARNALHTHVHNTLSICCRDVHTTLKRDRQISEFKTG